jgi:NhaP-type Na+/H+ and K+/H+ antiporter
MTQSRRMSFLEAVVNVTTGYGLAVVTQMAVFPLFGLYASMSDSLQIALVFTSVSIARTYIIRRLFENVRSRSNPLPHEHAHGF